MGEGPERKNNFPTAPQLWLRLSNDAESSLRPAPRLRITSGRQEHHGQCEHWDHSVPLVLATTTPGEPEIFDSLQGEGPSAGKACAFVRLSRCNLACVWCDTAYTWRFEGDNRPHRDGLDYERRTNQVTLSGADVAARIAALDKPRLVITGGEPLLQGAALARMLTLLGVSPRAGGGLGQPPGHADSVIVEIETNGTVAPPPPLDA